MHRRTFLKTVAAAGIGSLAGSGSRLFGADAAADAEVTLSPAQAQTVISPHIYGHFIEHLGGVIYDGIWVGRDSKIPNIDGIRKQFIDDMKALGAPNFRWPGGCFADGYHWRDGIGPADKRPRTYNYWQRSMPAGTQATETNQFGTHEFMRLCKLVGAQPYLAGNVGSGTPQEFHDWVSYCNAPAGTLSLAAERAANGAKDPFNVEYWGVGNESWGCGGDMSPEEYATSYRQFATQFPGYTRPFLIATGPRGHSADFDIGWTNGFFGAMQGGRRSPVNGFSMHYYTDFRNTNFRAADFTPEQWYGVLLKGMRLEPCIQQHWEAMGKFDPQHRTKLVVDEWGNWYPGGEELTPEFILSQPMTLRDGLHTALTFDIFNRNADKIAMANEAQTVNCLHSLILAHEDKYVRTPVYHVFEMYRGHMGGKLVPMEIKSTEFSTATTQGSARLSSLYGSASIRDKSLTVTLTNPSLDVAVNAQVRINGARSTETRGMVLTHEDFHAGNTFAKPNQIAPAQLPVRAEGDAIRVNIPKHSVVSLAISLT